MDRLEAAEELFQAARRDLRGLLGMLQVEEMFADELFGQHVQAATEKLAKAWITLLGDRYPRIHNLEALFQQLENLGCDVSDHRDLAEFTAFASQLRYQALLEDSDPIDRKSAIAQVQSFYNRVEAILQSCKDNEPEGQTDEESE